MRRDEPKAKGKDTSVNDTMMSEQDVYELLNSSERLRVTREELDEFDPSIFDVEVDQELRSIADSSKITARIQRLRETGDRLDAIITAEDVQGYLFGESTYGVGTARYTFEVTRQRFTSLIPLVLQAFADVRDGWSPDYVILEPSLDLEFLKRCWSLGAVATPEELNWTLMNARKDGKLSGMTSTNRYAISKKEMDSFSFAAEMALREIQEIARAESGVERLSLDKLLCSPRLSADFDRLAMQVASGYTPLQYRWAAMTLRKARRLASIEQPMPLFEDAGCLRDVRTLRLPTEAGVYWIACNDRSTFVGVADNLRNQVDSFIDRVGQDAMPAWLRDRPLGRPILQYAAMGGSKLDDRERLRSRIFRQAGSRLNFKDRTLFGGLEAA